MIQIKRGKSDSWEKSKIVLADGQPGYDKDKHKIKVGDGKSTWAELPYAGGMSAEDIMCSEDEAKKRHKADINDATLITYGVDSPNEKTVGQLYLQYTDAEPEADFVISTGTDNGWLYQKWNSGFATCSKVLDVTTSIQTAIDATGIYQNTTTIKNVNYPFSFKSAPSETATVQSPGGLVWLATAKGLNTSTHTAVYNILSADRLTNTATYHISIKAEGFWK